MKSITVHRRESPVKKGEVAKDSHASITIAEPTDVFCDGVKIIEYGHIDAAWKKYRAVLDTSKKISKTDYRSSGLVSTSFVFGHSTRLKFRKHICSTTGYTRDNPKKSELLYGLGELVDKKYKKAMPTMYKEHSKKARDMILPEWFLGNSVWTQGIVNYNNPLNYHTDTGNIPGTVNCLVAFGRFSGGLLVLPEYDVKFKFANASYIIMPAQDTLHGVTKMSGNRISVVFYTRREMEHCLSYEEEIRAANLERVETDKRRAKEGFKGTLSGAKK